MLVHVLKEIVPSIRFKLISYFKKTTVISTSTTDKDYIEPEAGNAIQSVFINRTLADLGIKNEYIKWIHFSRVNLTTDEKRNIFLKEKLKILASAARLGFISKTSMEER
ncbi:hypothetical protein AB0R75_08850 [Bacillus pumilus]|uniref:hypothetical protein n=1 Tax=Bacillus TaxID=1386 RepID=UPI002016C34C|nr:hypothetical protein [Bacillus pumilus]WIG33754.1 hypothetical protein QPL77_08860 [Bacillus pumilus]